MSILSQPADADGFELNRIPVRLVDNMGSEGALGSRRLRNRRTATRGGAGRLGRPHGTYNDVVLYYADFDATTRTVSNPVAMTDYDPAHICEYPRWSADESLILYDSNRTGVYQMYAYSLADRLTARLSSDPTTNSQVGSFEDVPK